MNSRGNVLIHIGVCQIAKRIGLGRDTVRKLLQDKVIRGYKTKSGAWYCIEAELVEDVVKLSGQL